MAFFDMARRRFRGTTNSLDGIYDADLDAFLRYLIVGTGHCTHSGKLPIKSARAGTITDRGKGLSCDSVFARKSGS